MVTRERDPKTGKVTFKGTPGNDNIRVSNRRNTAGEVDGLLVIVLDAHGKECERFSLDREEFKDGLCIRGGAGDDIIQVDEDVEFDLELYGEEGNDLIIGGAGNDLIDGGPGNDRLYGGEGNDTIHGGDGDDLIDGGPGDDKLYGGAGNDKILGGPGNDLLDGGPGDDCLVGGPGDDILIGGEDNDRLFGGEGMDQLIGGTGKDIVHADLSDLPVQRGNDEQDTVHIDRG
ncbi:calcium-binding protein [Gloeobacter violaceus]|uniref:Gll2473 protein n=1 Tax=Gloeobacter violaceus (strain ATCC 29082 / PCC 7421) TaxID=251221 RepID=Q7NHR2_GLOVI|nr:calcium-binding protein [Gloeobacter violaceus]BAC90414.1 gll2473 [Gloeobacter violaceus PCC 7421]